ncbi:MAG: ATP-binding protein [Acidobacteriota bacterium]|nr:ATP-binding protein [Acidobacteriota bacterium]MDH3524103.1 ATP-binding protein [Acidobacteriota bacterium]
MALGKRFARHRKDNRWIAGGMALLLAVLTGLFYLVQRSRDLPPELITNRVLLFVVWSVNLVLILAISFVLARNLFKLAVERRHRVLGSKFKTKLVLTYIALSLVPVLLLFAYGTRLLQGWLDRWFDEPAIEQLLDQGFAVAQELNDQVRAARQRDARGVVEEISAVQLSPSRRQRQLESLLPRELERRGLDALAVYDGMDFLHGVVSSRSALGDLPEPDGRFLARVLEDGSGSMFQPAANGSGRMVVGAAAGDAPPGSPRPVVIAVSLLDSEVARQSEAVIQAHQGFDQLKFQQHEISSSFFLSFLMVTLFLLLAVTWVGLYLARRVTEPIDALAEGTRRVSSGELDYRVEVDAGDELGVLVDSFNRMTGALEESTRGLTSANRQLAEERAVLSTVLQSTAAGVIAVDDEGTVLAFNGATGRMLRQPSGDVLGRDIREIWADPERGKLAELFGEAADRDGRLTRSVRLLLAGEWKTFEAKVTALRHEGGHLRGHVMVLEDLTELIHAQQRAAWNDAARRVAHEIKNPLTPIKLAAERLLRRRRENAPELAELVDDAVEIIVREVGQIQSMVDEFSRFARMRRPQPAKVDLARLVEETLHLYDGLKDGVEIAGEVQPDAASAWLDGEQVKRVLINLIDNAVEATEAPGAVRVSVERDNGALRIRVADTGRGIPPEAREKLFLPHFSTKGRGTGLGLSIVRRIIAEHHGTIRVSENQPAGTVFTVDIPQG